ncbi:hypothetical protein SR42_15050 [Clostridium botulinum]|nr:hypothetical protein SR42_15050 [Clostridium botulinum]MBN1042344.1 hypothetical protein [Clostridium botulinum]MBY6935322.1 hypothetical protein [Clostridium botulinum]NFL36256.1 hypothetical protein [Clostridium botulinum]NFL84864.1 hypothetical protein [Clostridium botulinum]
MTREVEINMKLYETHNEYILDVLEEEQDRLKEKLLEVIPEELEYSFNKLLEVVIEIVEINNKIAN